MKVNKMLTGLITAFSIIVITCICVICSSYVKNKPYTPDATNNSLISSNNLLKIKESYEQNKVKEKFIDTFKKLEQNISKKILDGNVINDETLNREIIKINEVLHTEDWSYINSDFDKYWMGSWSIDKNVRLSFKFKLKDIEPDWIDSEDVVDYIVKN